MFATHFRCFKNIFGGFMVESSIFNCDHNRRVDNSSLFLLLLCIPYHGTWWILPLTDFDKLRLWITEWATCLLIYHYIFIKRLKRIFLKDYYNYNQDPIGKKDICLGKICCILINYRLWLKNAPTKWTIFKT
jgi:hypothetical protein